MFRTEFSAKVSAGVQFAYGAKLIEFCNPT